ncbi:hypothetical protein SAMN06297387_10551 [Streptomyces zhaozhouensis]|uniref:Uncharacterized protein n=1 Tax=Streptomyces zhaozhouensis TaxID=1300267 RepID=A0A286DU91_9ACTN|nr:hypothetical protein [Streptomyces zhaozhouensis]SOD62236.1 hypothetical protein SAMN06297387_10551 [Streptomyces zhaozhouensis]
MTAKSEARKNRTDDNRTKAGTRLAVAKEEAEQAAAHAKGAEESAGETARAAGETAGRAGRAAAAGLAGGRQAVTSAAHHAASGATSAWTTARHHKGVSAGTAVGAVCLAAGAFALGRRSFRSNAGPLTRLTDGRI